MRLLESYLNELLHSSGVSFRTESTSGPIIQVGNPYLQDTVRLPILFHGVPVGSILRRGPTDHDSYLKDLLGFLYFGDFARNVEVISWVLTVRALDPNRLNWIGIYYKAQWLLGEKSQDLVLGPYFGEPTEHRRIPIDRGFCGLALREERTIVVDDVTRDPIHLACSLNTRSEMVVPLKDHAGNYAAELDMDSNQGSAFDQALQSIVIQHCERFRLGRMSREQQPQK